MKRQYCHLAAVCLMLVAGLGLPAAAFDQPSVNLGFTSFVDGGPPAGPGWYFTEYIQYYTADELVDYPVDDVGVDVWVSLNQLIYQSDEELFLGGKWGVDVIVPVVYLDADAAAPDNAGGIGDVLIGPFLQWDPIMGDNGPLFMHRVELQVIVPTGKYDEDKALNPGSNFLSLNPYWAGTLFITPKLTATVRAHYLWNDKNDDPWTGLPITDDAQAGEAFHANFAASYELMPKKLRAGVNGYYFRQIGDSEWDGESVSGREQVLGIGPGLLYSLSADTHLFFNAYFESHAKARPEGERLNVRLVHHF
jgi:anthranilate 1,2-dioxygenase (deaminating, decarboxylating) large subunit